MESAINEIRNILRSEGITGMDSINHCIFLTLTRFLTEDKCKKLKIDSKFTFDKLIQLDPQLLYEAFYVKGSSNCLLNQLLNSKLHVQLVKNFKIKSPNNLYRILEVLNNVIIEHSQLFDIVGTIYEFHLKSGTSNAMRDLGQYFTHRLVIKYMIELCEPKIVDDKVETIVDPTMGTGGFLTMAVKYLNQRYNVNWTQQQKRMYGFDLDETVKNLAVINLFLETGEIFENLFHEDTLKNDLKLDGTSKLEKAKIILANEPMGLKNITHASCCERIKNLAIRGTKAEPLFLQLFMEALDDGGRCAVIIPDGVLFNDSNLHKETRKYLIENFNLQKVISLDDNFFLNTGVKTSILFFKKDGNKTSEVSFLKIKLNENCVNEEEVITVNYNELVEKEYTLFVNKYLQSEEIIYQNIEYKTLEELCEFKQKSKRNASFGKQDGKFNFYSSSKDIKKCDVADYTIDSLIIGDGGEPNIKFDNKFSCSCHNFVLQSKTDIINLRYIYHYINNNLTLLADGFKGSTIKNVSKEHVKKIKIPIPPLQVQEEIVSKLHALKEANEMNTKLIETYKNAIKWYIQMKTKDTETVELGNVVLEIKTGKDIISKERKTGIYPFYGANGIIDYVDNYLFDGAYLLTARTGSIGSLHISNGKFWCTGDVHRLSFENNLLLKYIYYFLHIIDFNHYRTGVTYPKLSNSNLKSIKVKVQSIELQNEIVNYCDQLSNLIDYLEKQNELNTQLMKNIIETTLTN
jgi:type I restriction enzyme M protein